MRASSPSLVRSFLFACAVLLGLHASAQNFSGLSYQAVVRDNLGDPVANQPVGVQVTIQVGATGSYVETHSATTDAFGLIAITIGQGTPVGGSAIPSFAAVAWDSGLPITYSVAVDVTGGTNYTFLGGGPFKAVPFAMHALTSDSTAASAPQTLAFSNDTLYISNGNSVDLSGLADQPGWVLSGDTLHNDGRRVGIGTTSPDTTLHVVGGIQYQDGGQATGKLLTSDAQGNASWQALSPESIFGSGNVPGGAICLSNVATIATGVAPRSVAVSGSHAYVVNAGSNSMQVFNISNPAAPTLSATIATGVQPQFVAVSGSHAYVVNRISNTMQVFNISNPAAPTLSATIATGVEPNSVAVSGSHAYVVNYLGSTMQVFNISNPAAPTLSATIATGWPVSVAVSGSHAYVGNYSSNTMQVFNISDPTAPTLSATIATGVQPRSVAVSGNHAYVANHGSNNMMVFNISDPAAPTLSATIATGSQPVSLAISGSHACVVNNGSNTMQVFNISDPAAPTLSATIATGSSPVFVAVSGSHAYVPASFGSNMQVYSLFCPNMVTIDPVTGEFTSQQLAGLTQNGSAAGNTPYWDGTQWVTNSSNIFNNGGNVGIGTTTPAAKLDVAGTVKITDGTQGAGKLLTSDAQGNASWQALSPESIFGSGNVPGGGASCLNNLATIATGWGPLSVAVSGNNAYVVNQNINQMQVFNISNPAAPTLIGEIGTAGEPWSVAISGSHAYVVNNGSNSMRVYNISNPAYPTFSATIATGSGPASVAVSGSNAYVVNYNSATMQVFNISNPAAPTLSATIATGSQPRSVAVSGSRAYVVNQASSTMQVFNISNPAAPTLSATIATGSQPTSVYVSGSHAYVVNYNSATMQVFNISNPAAPTLSATIATGSQPFSVAVSGSNAYVVNSGSNNMMVYNISNPAAPTLSATIATGSNPQSVTTSGSHVYVVNATSNTLQVFNHCPQNMMTMDPLTGEFTAQPVAGLTQNGSAAGNTPYWDGTQWVVNSSNIFNNGGNVGIGTTTPQEALTVRTTNTAVFAPVTSLANSLTDLNFRLVTTRGEASNANGAATTQIGQAYGTGTMSEGLRFFRGTTTNDGSLALVTAGTERVRINNAGNLGIGTTNPIARLHVVPSNFTGYNPLPITYFNYGAGFSTINWTVPYLLAGYFEGNVVCTQGLITTNGALTVSDRRLKKIVGRSDNSRDLALLDRIRVTDYTFIDSIALGNTVQKKVIAQELEEVYPNAIMYKQEHIPDVYTLSVAVRHAEGRLFVTLDKPHGLAEGDHLKWIEENGTAHFDSVACVTDAYTFAIPAEKPQQRIFVWGRRVNDLRTVDYDAVTMLNVSATQELHKLVRDLQERNEALEQRNSVLDAELEGMRAQLEANTALMLKLQSVLEAQTRK